MLVLSRKVGQKIVIDERVTVTITRISGGRVSIGIEAPAGAQVRRSELAPLVVPEESLAEAEHPAVFVLPLSALPMSNTDVASTY